VRGPEPRPGSQLGAHVLLAGVRQNLRLPWDAPVSLIPAFYLGCVVAIGVPREEGEEGGPAWIGSGFFYGRRVGEREGVAQYAVYLATNKHVLGDLDHIVLRANPPADDPNPARGFALVLREEGQPIWVGHPNESVDVAAIRINFDSLRDAGMEAFFFENDNAAMTLQQLGEAGITEGDQLFVLGYPMGLVGDHRSVVIVRNGSIARIRDALAGTEETYLVDSSIFPGNSGGPVIIRPQAMAIHGTVSPTSATLIGIVSGYVSYTDIAYSGQTHRVRMIFEENSGLATAFPVDAIDQAIETDPYFQQMQLELAQPAHEAGPQPVAQPPHDE
jgi:S1-C subfamily serine protease